MKIKKYVADDFQKAIQMAKREMGQEAIILHTRHIKKGGFLGLFARPQVEITVASDDSLQVERDRSRKTTTLPSNANQESGEAEQKSELIQEMQQMKEIMWDIKSRMYEVGSIRGISDKIQEFYLTLVHHNVDARIAFKIASNVESRLPGDQSTDPAWVKEVCTHTLQEYIFNLQPENISVSHDSHIITMVGPTGVGKTTTIAKLAANLVFGRGQQVALITLDTYRISAAEQLRTFAEILDVPIKVVFNAADLQKAIDEFHSKDVIFIDTAGRSPFNSEHMEELKQYLEIAHSDEVILVLSVTASTEELLEIYKRFSVMNVNRLIFTKLDETRHYGQIINAMDEIRLPVAYFTTGQDVPDDIEAPDALWLAQRLLEKDEAL